MGQVLHASAKTTHVVRAAIQRSTATIAKLERRAIKLDHLTAAILVAGQADCTPWCCPTTSASQRRQRAKSPGPYLNVINIIVPIGVGKIGPSASLQRLPDATHIALRTAHRATWVRKNP